MIGAELVAKAKPDGYTLLMPTSSTMAINPAVYDKMPVRSDQGFQHPGHPGGVGTGAADRHAEPAREKRQGICRRSPSARPVMKSCSGVEWRRQHAIAYRARALPRPGGHQGHARAVKRRAGPAIVDRGDRRGGQAQAMFADLPGAGAACARSGPPACARGGGLRTHVPMFPNVPVAEGTLATRASTRASGMACFSAGQDRRKKSSRG